MVYSLRAQPFKGLYLAYAWTSILFVRLPWWTLISLLPSMRPRPSWSLQMSILIRFLRYTMHMDYHIHRLRALPDHRALQTDNGVNGQWVDPVPDSAIVGQLRQWADLAHVKPVRIPGYWHHKKGASFPAGHKPAPAEKVILFLHGGGYISLSAHPSDVTNTIVRNLLKHCTPVHRVFSLEYRLSAAEPLAPAHPFPAALIDALAGYTHLLTTAGFAPSQIIVAGDSAGGNLALALCRYLASRPAPAPSPALPIPAGLLLLSPWCDLGRTHDTPGSSAHTCAPSDIIQGACDTGVMPYAIRAFTRALPAPSPATSNVYISPASRALPSGHFTGFPRAFVVAGGAEVFLDQIRTLNARMAHDMGHDHVLYHEAHDAPHDFLVLGALEPQTLPTLRRIAAWVASL